MQIRYATVKDIIEQGIFGKTKFYDLIKKGVFPPPIKIGSRSFWKLEDIEGGLKILEAKRYK